MKIFCKLGFHRFESMGTQTARGLAAGFGMAPIIREINKCKKCGNIKYFGLNISTKAHLDNELDWRPKLDN